MKKIFYSFTIIIFSTLFLTPAVAVSAAENVSDPVQLFNRVCEGRASDSSVCEDAKSNSNPLFGPTGIITKIANLLSILVGIAAVIGIILAGVKMAIHGNNPQEVSQARDLVIYAVAGLVLAAMAQALVRLVLFNIRFN